MKSIFQYIFCFIICDAHFSNALNLYDDIDVTELTPETFQNLIIDDKEIWMVVFYVPWCLYCKDLATEYINAARKLRGVIEFGAVNCVEHDYLRDKFNISSFPVIKIFGKDKNAPIDYLDGHKAKEIIRAALTVDLNYYYYKS